MNSLLQHILSNFLLLAIAGMLLVWGWVVRRLIHHRRISLPRFARERPEVRWGLGTMVLVFVVYNAVNLGVVYSYLFATGRNDRDALRPEHAATAGIRKQEPLKAAKPEEKASELPTPAAKASPEEPKLSVPELLFLLTLINEILIVAIPILVRATSGTRLVDLGVIPSDWTRQLLVGVSGALFVAPIVYSIQFLAVLIWTSNDHPVENMIRDQFTSHVAYLAFLSAVVMAPIVEELVFRGLIQNWLLKLASRQELRKPLLIPELSDETWPNEVEAYSTEMTGNLGIGRPALQAIVLTSFFFAVVHFEQWPAPIPIFVLSLAIGTVYHLTGSLLASIAMHATFNGLSTLMLFLAMSGSHENLPVKNPLPPAAAPRVLTPTVNMGRFQVSTTD